MSSTDFSQWNPAAANQENDATYQADALRTGGAINGPWPPQNANKVLYQTSTFMRAFAVMMAGKDYSLVDGTSPFTADSSVNTAVTNLATVLNNVLTKADIPNAVNVEARSYGTGVAATGDISLTGAEAEFYRVSAALKVTRAAGVSSTIGPVQIKYTDNDGTAMVVELAAFSNSGTIETSDSGNSLTSVLMCVPIIIRPLNSTIIYYNIGYASSGSPGMEYSYQVEIEEI